MFIQSAAVEQLEESRNKIESLLNWLSQVDEKGENGNLVKKPTIQQNGTYHKDSELQSILDGVEEVNGNLIESDGKINNVRAKELSDEDDLSTQYQKVKVQYPLTAFIIAALLYCKGKYAAFAQNLFYHKLPINLNLKTIFYEMFCSLPPYKWNYIELSSPFTSFCF